MTRVSSTLGCFMQRADLVSRLHVLKVDLAHFIVSLRTLELSTAITVRPCWLLYVVRVTTKTSLAGASGLGVHLGDAGLGGDGVASANRLEILYVLTGHVAQVCSRATLSLGLGPGLKRM